MEAVKELEVTAKLKHFRLNNTEKNWSTNQIKRKQNLRRRRETGKLRQETILLKKQRDLDIQE